MRCLIGTIHKICGDVMNKKTYSVYIHRCIANGKRYVGITSMPPEKRWANGAGYKKNRHFWGAICQYGWSGFEHIIYKSNLCANTAYRLEKKLIAELRTNESEFGYNLSSGGEHSAMGVRKFGYDNYHSIPVYCPELDEDFGSISLAARFTGTSTVSIRRCIDGIKKTAGRSPFTGLPVTWTLQKI